jgi:hypothetical protein
MGKFHKKRKRRRIIYDSKRFDDVWEVAGVSYIVRTMVQHVGIGR